MRSVSLLCLSYLFVLPLYLITGIGDMMDTMRGESFPESISSLTDDGESTLARLIFFIYFLSLFSNGSLNDYLAVIINIIFEDGEINVWGTFKAFIPVSVDMFYFSLKFIIPFIFLDLIVAIVSKFNQQLNLLTFSMPIKSIIALTLLLDYL